MIEMKRVNFVNPVTSKNQNGFGCMKNGKWIIKSYHNEIFKDMTISASFETHLRSIDYVNNFFGVKLFNN